MTRLRTDGRRAFLRSFAAAAVALPAIARGQAPKANVIGFLGSASATQWSPFVAAFRRGLGEGGIAEGKDASIEFRWAEGRYDALPQLAAELVRVPAAVIVATGGARSGLAAKAATSTIPIVFTTGGDPVAQGLVDNLGRPGGNVTGVSFFTSELLLVKRLELLRELVPKAREVALFVNPAGLGAAASIEQARKLASAHGARLRVLEISREQDIESAMASFAKQRPDAFLVEPDPVLNAHRERFVALAARYAVPAVYEGRESVVAGGLMSYGPSLTDAYRQVGVYTARIMKGAKPGDLPVLRPTKFDLVVNLGTARALGIAVPGTLLSRADEVVQ